jgi:general secretion pathway protein G
MRKKGFTLIELLVVISIIGLLSSIALASLKDARRRAQYVAAQQGFKSVANALELYKTETGDYPSGDGLLSQIIATPGMSKYIKAVPNLPTDMKVQSIYYRKNPTTTSPGDPNNGYWKCHKDVSPLTIPTNGYLVTIQLDSTSAAPPDITNYFPQTYKMTVRKSDGRIMLDTSWAYNYCAVVPTK